MANHLDQQLELWQLLQKAAFNLKVVADIATDGAKKIAMHLAFLQHALCPSTRPSATQHCLHEMHRTDIVCMRCIAQTSVSHG